MKNILVVNTSYFGDVLLTNTLCQNIKIEYPNSWITFMVNKPFYEVAKYMQGVDAVLCYDKNGKHKGILGIFKFLQEYRQVYKNKFDIAFVLYGNERGIFISKAFGADTIISNNHGILHFVFLTKSVAGNEQSSVQQENASLIKGLTQKDPLDLPVKYNPPLEAISYATCLLNQFGITSEDYLVGLCATSKKIEKDIPIDTAIKVISDLSNSGKKVVLLGAGNRAAEYVTELHAQGCSTFVDFTNKTSIAQLAGVIQHCKAVISVDTGTLHLTCALGIPLVALFYINDAKHLTKWAPAKYYPHVLLTGNITSENIKGGLQQLVVK